MQNNKYYQFYLDYIRPAFYPARRNSYLDRFSSLAPPKKKIKLGEKWYVQITRGIFFSRSTIDINQKAQMMLNKTNNLPLVSCLMVTKDRFSLAQKAINNFIQQTYPNIELIIIDDGESPKLKNWVSQLKNSKIKFYHLPDESKPLGVLRNLSRKYANGTYVAQWDDDDISHPDRVLFQMTLILILNLDGCSLQREQLWFPHQQRFGYSGRRLWEGSMIGHQNKLPLYREVRRGEETGAINSLALSGKIALLDFPELYTYCYHQKNTFGEKHFEKNIWNHATKIFDKSSYLKITNTLERMTTL